MTSCTTRRETLLALASTLIASATFGCRTGPRSHASPSLDSKAFLEAVRRGDAQAVATFLVRDAALASARDEAGRSAFVVAHLAGHDEVAELLRETGIELDLVESVLAEDWERAEALAEQHPELLNAAHPIGGTPLYAGAYRGGLELYRLRSFGCAPDAAPAGGNGLTPARGALEVPSPIRAASALTELCSNGADVNAPQRNGDSVLHACVRRRDERLVRLAIRKGAAVEARDARGRTAHQLAQELGWEAGRTLLEKHAELPRDHRASRFALDANGAPIQRPDLSDVPLALQSQVTGSSHARLEVVRELVAKDARLVFSISTDDELAIEACAHVGNHEIIRYHLDHGAPLSLPTAVSLQDAKAVRALLERDPLLIHERGAHDFPVLWYAAIGGGSIELAELLHAFGADLEQESMGGTALHWCVMRDRLDLARWLIEHGADVEALAYRWDLAGETPLSMARAKGREELARLLQDSGARV